MTDEPTIDLDALSRDEEIAFWQEATDDRYEAVLIVSARRGSIKPDGPRP